MPYVTVVFDPTKVSQETVDKLKPWLQPEVARVLSMLGVVYGDSHQAEKELRTSPDEIMVVQQATHPTDVNVPPLEIYIQAGRPKNRDGDRVVKMLGQLLSEARIIPDEHLGDTLSGIFVTFHEYNGFGFIPRPQRMKEV